MSDTDEFADLARRVLRRLGAMEREQVCCADITLQQFHTLRALREGGMATGPLAELLGIDLSTASRNLAVLEKNGYLSRVRAETNSRQVENRLTPMGKNCIETLCCDEQVVYASVLERVPEEGREMLLESLRLLVAVLERPPTAPETSTSAQESPRSAPACCQNDASSCPIRPAS